MDLCDLFQKQGAMSAIGAQNIEKRWGLPTLVNIEKVNS